MVGLGLIGSAALHALARRGADVLGFDPLQPGEPRGSSHGSCRIFRRFNFESDDYTELSDRAYAGWRALEAASGRRILRACPVLEAGPPGSDIVDASRAAASQHSALAGPETGAEANRAYPALRLPDDWDVVVQQSGGILMAQAALAAFRDGVEDRIMRFAAQVEPTPAGVRIATDDGDVLAGQAIVAAGPWIGALAPGLAACLKVTRQPVGWFAPAAPELAREGRLPVFILDGPQGLVYGFPDFEGRGVKAALHNHGPVVGPDDWGPAASDAELAPVAATLAALAPGTAGPIVDRDVCLYTNTLRADADPDAGEEFILGRLPADPRLIVASACSGHGAKFATAIGEMLASLALDPRYEAPPAFRPERFSSLAARA